MMKSCKSIVENYSRVLHEHGIRNFVHYDDFVVTIDILSGTRYRLGNYHIVVDWAKDTFYLTEYRPTYEG